MSLPSRERGLKYVKRISRSIIFFVAPLAGAWIEITGQRHSFLYAPVAPLAGAWIEIIQGYQEEGKADVAPLAGAWIEILSNDTHIYIYEGRSPRGSVD